MKRAASFLAPVALVLVTTFTLIQLPHVKRLQRIAPAPKEARDVIASYAEWHAQQRRCLRNASCSPRLLVWQCPHHSVESCAGLGDRMRGVQFALLLAILTQRVLLLDWPADPFEIHTVLQPAAINWTVPSKRMAADLVLDWYTCNPGNVCESVRFPSVQHLPLSTGTRGNRTRQRLRDFNLLQEDAQQRLQPFERVSIIQRLKWNTTRLLLDTYNSRKGAAVFRGFSDLQLQRALTRALFQPSPAVARRMRQFDALGSEYAAVHVRTGEDFKENDARFTTVVENESKAATLVIQEVKSALQRHPNVSSDAIYVACDSHRLKHRLRAAAKKEGLRVRGVQTQALHIAKIGLKHEKVQSQRQLRRMFVDVFVDLFMLARARVLLSSGSGFSNAAWMLGDGHELVRVALPQQLRARE